MASDEQDPPKIHIDSDWKAQAQAEKEQAAQQAPQPDAQASGPGQPPPANFETLISSFVTQALFALGAIPDPRTGQPALHLDLARHQIDMLSVLEEKTKGNLTDDETDLLASTLYELRTRYVQVASASKGQAPAS